MSLEKRKIASTKEKISLLSDPTGTWSYVEVMKYFGFSYGKANNLLREIECKKGAIPYYEGKAKRRCKIDDIFEMFGSCRKNELEFNLIKQYQREDTNEKA